ncbi:MAG: desulfoferrodoxin [Desulfobulbus sp.]|nr:desulfoferrodoxin [Desulfobulbus sp.]
MSQKNEVYKCALCGTLVEILHAGAGGLTCCGQTMSLMTENTIDAAKEKHVPVITKVSEGYKVSVGSVPHPMEAKHWIEFIELIADGKVYRQNLDPGDTPEAIFCIKADQVSAREYCNLHGLWKA